MRRHGWRRSLVSAAVLVFGVTAAGTAEGRADSDVPPTLEARAVAEGGRIGFAVPGFAVVEQIIDGGGPVTEARTDVLGNSRAFAALPYPGDAAINGPSTVAGVAGLPSPPAYPFYAGSSYPLQEKASMRQPGWELHAESKEFSSEATAFGGAAGDQASFGHVATKAAARRDPVTGAVESTATSALTGFRIADALSIGAVTVSARAARSSLAIIDRTSSLQVEGLVIGGQAVSVSEAGLSLAGSRAAMPDSSPVLSGLKAQGISIIYMRPEKNAEGVTSAGLVIVHEMKSPSGQTLRFTYNFGRASAQVPSQSID
jgi:hypothetical protein